MIESAFEALEYIQAELRRRPHQPVDYQMVARELQVHEDTAKDVLNWLREAGLIECLRLRANGSGQGGGYFPAAVRAY